jgi:hypothetical protein
MLFDQNAIGIPIAGKRLLDSDGVALSDALDARPHPLH